MKTKKITPLAIAIVSMAPFLLCGCFADKPEAASTTPVPAPSLPTITVSASPPAPLADTVSSEIPDSPTSFDGYELSESDINNPRVVLKEASVSGQVTMVFGGDICFDDGYSNMLAYSGRKNGIFDSLSGDLMSELQQADICMLNNEFPYSLGGSPTPEKQYTFRADPRHVDILNQMGVDIVSLANNHAYDYGPDALMDTFDTLESASVPYVGAGRTLEEAMKPVYFISGGKKIAFVSATQIERLSDPDTKEATVSSPGVLRTLDPERFLTVIEKAKSESDFVVVYVHWGSENTIDVEQSQRDLATSYVQAGANLILGDHSHCLQGFEYINDVPVIYSLGNFWFNSKLMDTCITKVVIDSTGIASYQFIPCMQHDCRTDLLLPGTTQDYERVLAYMESISYGVGIDESGEIYKKESESP